MLWKGAGVILMLAIIVGVAAVWALRTLLHWT